MRITDFGKNTYQFELAFRFDCISPHTIRSAAELLTANERGFSTVGKDPTTGQSTITRGVGTPDNPLLQVKMSTDKITVWAGWGFGYDDWLRWRDAVVVHLSNLVRDVRVDFVASLVPQMTLVIPTDRMKPVQDIPELSPLISFHQRYVPADLLSRFGSYNAFGNEAGSETLEWSYAAGGTSLEGTFMFIGRQFGMQGTLSLKDNMLSHLHSFDERFSNFHSHIVHPALL